MITQINFPKQLNSCKYTFVGFHEQIGSKFQLGEYKDADGKVYLAKSYVGKPTDAKYNYLKNSLVANNILESIVTKHAKDLDTFNIYFPKIVYSEVSNTDILILYEFVQADWILNVPEAEQVTILTQVFAYFSKLSKFAKEADNSKLAKKTKISFILAIPLLAIVASLKHVNLFATIITAITQSVSQIPNLLKSNNYGYVHRDLNGSNILVNYSKTYIIDFQLFTYSLLGHDIGNALYRFWSPEKSVVFNELANRLLKNSTIPELKFMLLYAPLFDLSFGTAKKTNEIANYINFITNNNAN